MTSTRTRPWQRLVLSIVALATGATLTACSATPVAVTGSDATTIIASATEAWADNADSHAQADDLDYDAAAAISITLADGDTTTGSQTGVSIDGDIVTITAPGSYVVSGTLSDGRIVVNSEAEGKVRLVLDDADITSATGAAIDIRAADEVVVVLADGSTNALADGTGYDTSADDAANAALFSMADLTIGGAGSLVVTGNTNDGIASKDGLVILSGTITVTAADDGIRGKDYLIIADGTVEVTATGDGLTSDNETDDTVGYLLIQGGKLTVGAGDDGAHAEGDLAVQGGTVTIDESTEGLEGATVTIAGGQISVTASDDGLNATAGTSDTDGGGMQSDGSLLTISGGTLTVDSGGDGLDSNGAVVITGGNTVVAGPTTDGNAALDSNGGITVSGGSLFAAGAAGMAETPGADSSTGWVAVTFDQPVTAGQTITIESGGEVIARYTAVKDTASLIVADPAIDDGASYEVAVDGSATTTVTAGEGGTAGMAGPGGRGGGQRP